MYLCTYIKFVTRLYMYIEYFMKIVIVVYILIDLRKTPIFKFFRLCTLHAKVFDKNLGVWITYSILFTYYEKLSYTKFHARIKSRATANYK